MTTSASSPVDLLNNLKFDKMSIDVSAAEHYLIQNKLKHSFVDPETAKLQGSDLIDAYQKWINEDIGKETIIIKFHQKSPFETDYENIAEKIEESKNLFAELEYLLRNIDIEEVKKYDVSMIVKGFQCYTKEKPNAFIKDTTTTYFTKDQPLAVLGMVAEMLLKCECVQILCDPATAFVTKLFADLISETECLRMQTCDIVPFIVDCNKFKSKSKGCVAVVTEKSDIDSVIETLAGASHNYRYPWCLRRVIVQESVYRSFRTTLSRKARRSCSGTDAGDVEETLAPQTAAAAAAADSHHVIHGKIFLIEHVGAEDLGTAPFVLVEAYRTTKELLSLLHKYNHNYLSLWCTDVSVSNEITFGSKALNVAINDYGVYEGSKDFYDVYKAAFDWVGGVYSMGLNREFKNGNNTFSDDLSAAAKEVRELRNGWLKIDFDQRFDKINKVILIAKDKNLFKSNDELKQVESVSFVDVEKTKLTFGITEPRGVVYIEEYANIVGHHLIHILHSIIRGNGVVINPRNNFDTGKFEILIDLLNSHKIPIKIVSKGSYRDLQNKNINDIDCFILCLYESALYNKKVVWSRFGETFAN